MDERTLAAYDLDAAGFAAEWLGQTAPEDMYALLRRFFRPGVTADIGCGVGRDTAWLAANGFDAAGFDASEGLLGEARLQYPELVFRRALLPDLAGVDEGGFMNVLCETVIMHLPAADVAPSVRKLVALLAPGGTLYLSWRVTEGADRRDSKGRLYAAFDPGLVLEALGGAAVLLDEQAESLSSGRVVRRLVCRKHNE